MAKAPPDNDERGETLSTRGVEYRERDTFQRCFFAHYNLSALAIGQNGGQDDCLPVRGFFPTCNCIVSSLLPPPPSACILIPFTSRKSPMPTFLSLYSFGFVRHPEIYYRWALES